MYDKSSKWQCVMNGPTAVWCRPTMWQAQLVRLFMGCQAHGASQQREEEWNFFSGDKMKSLALRTETASKSFHLQENEKLFHLNSAQSQLRSPCGPEWGFMVLETTHFSPDITKIYRKYGAWWRKRRRKPAASHYASGNLLRLFYRNVWNHLMNVQECAAKWSKGVNEKIH